MDSPKEIWTIWSAEFVRSVRSARTIVLLALYLMFTVITLLVSGFIGSFMGSNVEAQISQSGMSDEQAAETRQKLHDQVAGKLVGVDEPRFVEAVRAVPLSVLFGFNVSLFFLPLYIALLGFDQLSGEVGPRSMRYLIVRARRESILLGKFLAQALLLFLLVAVVNVGIFGFAKATTPEFPLLSLLVNLLRFGLAAMVFSLAYLGMTTLCSALFRTPAVSLVFNLLLLFAFWIVYAIGRWEAEPDASLPALRHLRWLTPNQYSSDLLNPDLARFAASFAASVGFTAVFLGLAHLVLRRRDL